MMGNNKAFLETNKLFLDGGPKAFLEGGGGGVLKPPFLNFPGFPAPPLEDFPRHSPGEFHQAFSLYQEELARLQQSAALAHVLKEQDGAAARAKAGTHRRPSPVSASEDDSIEAVDSCEADAGKSEEVAMGGKQLVAPPGFFSAVGGGGKTEDTGGSPLQRMASITNALVSQPPPVNFPGSSPRPLKHALPPISQQQFDRYAHVNTDDTVRRIKEILSQYSISQRLFGEAVLGLSQVSSLYTVYSVTFSQRLFGVAVLGVSQVSSLYTVYTVTFSQRLFGEAVLGLSQVRTLYTVYSATFSRGSSERLLWGSHR